MKNLIFYCICFSVLSQTVSMASESKFEILAQGSRSWEGSMFNYPAGDVQITIARVMVSKGEKIPLHYHPAPLAAYVMNGAIEVTTLAGKKKTFYKGEAFIETMGVAHYGIGIEKQTELLVFYAWVKDLPLSIKAADK